MNPTLRLAAALMLLGYAALHSQETWTAAASPTTQNLWSVCYGGGQFVAAGEGGTILTSPEGVTWTKRVSGSALWLVGICYGNGLFVIVGDQSTILTSPDGITWTTRRTGGTRINAVAYGNGMFLAVDEGGGSWTSPDGLTWSPHSTARPVQLRGLVYAAPVFVVTGASGTIQTTADGVNFTLRLTNTASYLESVAYGRRLFVSAGASGTTYTSREAINWKPQSNAPAHVHGLCFFNNQFVGIGAAGSIATSFDGSAWTLRPSGTSQLIIAIAPGENSAIAVGFGGAIVRSLPAQAAPAIVTPPSSLTEAADSNVLLSVNASGTAPLGYQWSFAGNPIVGATSETLLIPHVGSANSGDYAVRVTNALGSATSTAATLTVVPTLLVSDIVDPTFNYVRSPISGINDAPTVMAVQSDGRVVIGGDFVKQIDGVSQRGIARLDVDGSIDRTFAVGSGFNSRDDEVFQIVVQPDARILVVGNFSSVSGIARASLVRFHATGEVDTSFVPPANLFPARGSIRFGDWVNRRVTVQPDGRILVVTGGDSLVRLNPDGSIDPAFGRTITYTYDAGKGGPRTDPITPLAIGVFPSGKVFLQGADYRYSGGPRGYRTRLNSDGTSDPTYRPILLALPLQDIVQNLVVTSEESVFLSTHNIDGVLPVWAVNVSSWTVEWLGTNFPRQTNESSSGLTGSLGVAALDAAGRVIIAVSSVSRDFGTTNRFYRYLPDGTIDPTFDPGTGPDNEVSSIAILPDGKLLVLGSFRTFNGQPRYRLARLLERNSNAHSPTIVAVTPQSVITGEGDAIVLSATAAGTGPYQFAWRNKATNDSATLSTTDQLRVTTSGRYVVTLLTGAGTVSSQEILVRFNPTPPTFTRQPATLSVDSGRTAVFTATAKGSLPLSYQWYFNGAPIPSANGTTFTLTTTTTANVGNYTVVVTNSIGSATSQPAGLTLDDTSHLANLSTRSFVGTGENILITGFIVNGPVAKTILLRGIGPSLAGFGVSDVVANPKLRLFDSTGAMLAENDDWGGGPSFATVFAQAGAFSLPQASLDSAILRSLDPGSYTVQLSGVGSTSGIGLIECYEFDQQPSRLINLSSRVVVGTGASAAISGFVIMGPVSRKLLIRAVGPTLASFGVQSSLADPFLTVIGPGNAVVASNDDWSAEANAAEIATTATKVGAFALPATSRDAALLITLPSGAYNALVSGANNTSGVALMEVYEAP